MSERRMSLGIDHSTIKRREVSRTEKTIAAVVDFTYSEYIDLSLEISTSATGASVFSFDIDHPKRLDNYL